MHKCITNCNELVVARADLLSLYMCVCLGFTQTLIVFLAFTHDLFRFPSVID
jgi:hypothetical protein